MQLHYAPGLARLIPIAIAALGLGVSAASAATAAPRVGIVVGGKSFGNGKSLRATSAPWIIAPSKLYSYSVTATCSGVAPLNAAPGTLTLAKIVPAGTSLGAFMNSISPGSSSLLKGTYKNPTGTLPVVVVNRKISGSKTLRTIGKVSVSLNLKVQILASGQAVIDVTNVSIKSAAGKIPGTIKFGKGSKVTLTTAPEVQFETPGQTVGEADGFVKVVVWRFGNQSGTASARYTTVDGTAKAGVDYTAVSGVVKFLDKETVKTISIPITNNAINDGYRKFTVNLSNPSKGVVFGPRTIETIGIANDD